MNLDLAAQINFGDLEGLKHFFMDHRMVHEAESTALTQKFGGVFSTFGLYSALAEDGWIQMTQTKKGPTPNALLDWLQVHADIHNQTYTALGQGDSAPDLSIVDFSNAEQFYNWMYAHQQMHDFEQATLGIS